MSPNIQNHNINIFLAGPRGFCAGVERAILIVEEALKKYGKPVYVRHEIVHNKYVVNDLKMKGAIFVNELDEIKDLKRPVIFSAHGVPKSVPNDAKKLKLLFHDATCPLVSKIHREVENYEKKDLEIILIGHHNHPEVIGTMGQISKKIHLIENENDLEKLNIQDDTKVAYVTQTTLSVDETSKIIKRLKQRFPKIIEPKKNDICYATTNRQEAVKKIADKCDLFIVLGGKNSSNSLRLVEVAKKYGAKKSILIDKIEDFKLDEIYKIKNLGITAGASSPEILVKNFIENLKNDFKIKLFEDDYKKENIIFKIPQNLKSLNN